ncbi:alpha-E domain-containing protein [Rhizobium beringeri]
MPGDEHRRLPDPQCPDAALACPYCYEKIVSNLGYLAQDYEERLPAHDTADAIRKTLQTRAIRDIMDQGLHEFLEDFVSRNNKLGAEISDGYRFYV